MARPATASKPRPRAALAPARAHGRSLGDFGRLSRAERKLLDCCGRGEIAVIGEERPEKPTAANRVRAAFIRFLALGGDARAPVHEQGVNLAGAWLVGVLDLDATAAERRIGLWKCVVERIDARHARLKVLSLTGSLLSGGLMGAGLHCEGDLILSEEFHATGQIRLVGARIEGDLDCEGARLECPGVAMSCDNARVGGRLLFRDLLLEKGEVAPLKVTGLVDLCLLQVGSLCDQRTSWDGARLILDGFTYGRLTGGAPTDAESRIAWLDRQLADHLDAEFKPQPWEQLASVLRTMGHGEEARAVAVAKHERMRAAKRYVGGSRAWDWIYGNLVGYGYRPWKLLTIAFWVWAAGVLVYGAAVNPGLVGTGAYYLGPPRSEPSLGCLVQRAAARSAEACPPPAPRYQDFFAPTYSLEIMLPVVNLGGKERWQPVVSDAEGRPLVLGHMLRAFYWLQTAFGWLAGLLLVGVVGTLIKKD